MVEPVKDAKQKMKNAKEHLIQELKNIRTGRANPALLDVIQVEVYGAKMRLKDIANITAPETRQLLISPFDSNNTASIGKAIEYAELNVNPIVEGNLVRINIPPMDENQRKEQVKQAKKKGEEGKVTIRNIRRECNDSVKRLKNSQEITEDIMHKNEKDVQKLTDQFCQEIDNLIQTKEKDILTI
jgi:ribosome recycling factor